MLYDLASGPPEPGSLLESVFLLISLRRRESELFQTEAIITAVLAAGSDKFEPVEHALKAYKDAMFPFLEAEKTKRSDMAKAALKQWTDHKAFRVRPLWTAYDGRTKRMHSQLKKSAERTQQAEALRKKKRHTRI
jgi:hypothetical protein